MRPRYAFLLVLTLILSACSNRVISEKPWFSSAGQGTGPRLREGVWLSEDQHCKINKPEPAELWPRCAHWAYQRGNESLSLLWVEQGAGRHRLRTDYAWSASENMIVDGDPLLRQSTGCPMVEEPAEASREAAPGIPMSAPPMEETTAAAQHARYCYEALKATAFDAEGRITAIEAWPVVCGPWPRNGGNVTDQPWSGLSLVGDNCMAANEAALRDAAKRSRDVAEELHFVGHFQWIRDGYH